MLRLTLRFTTALCFFVVCAACGDEKIDVVDNNAPVAVVVGANVAARGVAASFAGSGSSDVDGSIVSFVWDFGVGGTAAGIATQHIFNAAGTFTVTLTVTDDDGAVGSDDLVVVVDDNEAPTAFIAAADVGSVGVVVGFDASGSSDVDGSIVSFAWDAGDGSTGTGATFDHAFASAGSFLVTLTVTDDDGATAEAEHEVVVSDAPASVDGEWRWFLTDESVRDLGFLCGGSFQDSELTIVAAVPNISVTEHAGDTNVPYSGTFDGTHFEATNEQAGIVQSIIGDFTSTTAFSGIYRIATGLDDCADRPVSGVKQ